MDIKERLALTNELVTKRLGELLKTPDGELEKLYDSMRYATLSAGKRVRPHLVLEFSRMFGGTDEKALDFACAIEMIHAFSLVHDDMPCMDNDDLRRGKPTCHKAYGEGMALLCGDALCAKGAEVALNNEKVSKEMALEAGKLLLKLSGGEGMMGGQAIDIESENVKISFDTLLKLQALKTGALMRTSALLGCLAAGISLDDERAEDADAYATALGLAFQITDDILDAGTEENKTFLSFMSIDDARKYAQNELEKAIKSIEKYSGSEPLIELAKFILTRNI